MNNKKKAFDIWNKTFGKNQQLAEDFSGRKIDKSGYGNNNHKYGWNLEHIYPSSQGGKNNEENLTICHILTNREKGNKFPTFKANNQNFQIVKNGEHWSIQKITKQETKPKVRNKKTLFDADYGLELIDQYEKQIEQKTWCGFVQIHLFNLKNKAIIPFISKVFKNNKFSIFVDQSNDYEINIVFENLDKKDKVSAVLDNCILLNTYLPYFCRKGYLQSYKIMFDLINFEDKQYSFADSYCFWNNTNFNKPLLTNSSEYLNTLIIGYLVHFNTEAKDKGEFPGNQNFVKYNYSYTNLEESLKNK